MTSSSSSTGHVYHHVKFRWTENLTCRFIQLRKEHGKMFTGRKYSAQAGWEYILRQMREEFPTIMADVHYRVLKKKWSNLLQQYKELKNPVHGDKNKADDISWPFYAAIDEVLGNVSPPPPTWRCRENENENDEDDEEDDLVNPQEFLYVSVDNDEEDGTAVNPSSLSDNINEYNGENEGRLSGLPRLQPLGREGGRGTVFDVERSPRTTRRSTTTTTTTTTNSRKRSAAVAVSDEADLLSRLPRATELTIRPVVPQLERIGVNGRDLDRVKEEEDERPRKYARGENYTRDDRESRLEKRIVEFLEYTKKRDEENRSILLRMLEVIEDIRRAVS